MMQAKAGQRPSLIEVPDRHGMPELAKGGQAKPIVMVLGMHRSGTSLCSHVLSVLGVDMADRMFPPGSETAAFDNPRGHWERWEIVAFHDRVLAHFNRGYWTPSHDLPLPAGWWADPEIAAIRREMVEFLAKRVSETRFGFKDPRTVRLMPLWQQIFDDLNLAPKFVLCLRNPAEVARSLATRDGLPPAMGECRWLIHMVDFFRYIGEHEYCTVEYEKWFDDPRENATKLEKFLDLGWQQSQREVDLALSNIVDPALRHDSPKRSNSSLMVARSLYGLAARADHEAAAREEIQQVTTQFLEFQQCETPFRNAFEQATVAAAKLPESERQVAELQAALAAAAEETAGLRVGLAEREAGLARGEADAADLRAALDERMAASQQAGREIGERDAAIAMLQNELAAVRAGFAQQQAAASEAMQANHAAALKAVRAELASARTERTAATAALQAELASARTERTAATAALQAELASMRDELAAARQVGRSLLAALRTGPVLAPPTEQPGRRRKGIFRLIRYWH